MKEDDFNYGAVFCQLSFKVSPEVKKAIKQHGINISTICRAALIKEIKFIESQKKEE